MMVRKIQVCKESSIMDLQEEIVADILSRTPIVTIVHCRCVCKTWRTILSEPYFIHLHLPRSPVGLISHQSNSPDYEHYDIFKLGELGEEPDHHDVHFDPIMKFDLGLGFDYIALLLCGTVNGLTCLWNYHDVEGYICNLVTREYILLPDHKYDVTSLTNATHGFGYVEGSNEYKVVSLFMETNLDMSRDTSIDKSECKIYTLGTGIWRSLGHVPFSGISVHNGVYVSGNLHWLTIDHKDKRIEMVCTFDLEKEKFHLTASAPLVYKGNVYDGYNRGLGTLGGCLCISDNTADSELSIWVMKDYGMKEIWTKEIVIRDKPIRLQCHFVRPLVFLESGSILFVCLGFFLFTYCPEYGTLQFIESGPNVSFDTMVYVPSFIRLKSFELEKVLIF